LSIADLYRTAEHEQSLRDYFGDLSLPGSVTPYEEPISIMLFVNRSGSTLLGEYLRATGAFSGFGEPLSHTLVIERCTSYGLKSISDYLKWLLDNIAKPGTQFGMKLSLDQVIMLYRVGVIPKMFPNINWIKVYRHDLLAQAISFSIAAQTESWQSFERSNGRQPDYDFEDIRWRLEEASNQYRDIATFIALQGLNVYNIAYEDFLQAPDEHCLKIAGFCGEKPGGVERARLQMRRQSSDINQDFRQRFLADVRSRKFFELFQTAYG
jgi:LPS sulfotransferase NodH